MKNLLRKLCSPILNPLERSDAPYHYKPSSRYILIAISGMFAGLSLFALYLRPEGELGYLLPTIVFGILALLGLIVGLLGEDRAVARIWGSK